MNIAKAVIFVNISPSKSTKSVKLDLCLLVSLEANAMSSVWCWAVGAKPTRAEPLQWVASTGLALCTAV